jgi:hypothetical protein
MHCGRKKKKNTFNEKRTRAHKRTKKRKASLQLFSQPLPSQGRASHVPVEASHTRIQIPRKKKKTDNDGN